MRGNIKDDVFLRIIKITFILTMFLFILIIGFLIGSAIVYADTTNINIGACYYENLTNTSYCANNLTMSYLNISLYPGDIKHYVNDSYNITAECINNVSIGNKCIVDKTLQPGDHYIQQSALCELDIKVDNIDNNSICDTTTTTYTKEYKIRYSNQSQRIQFNFNDQERIWNLEDNIDITGGINYECPTNIIGGNSTINLLADQCRAVVPLYCNDLATLMINRFDTCETKRAEYENKLEDCRRADVNKVTLSPEELAQIQSENLALLNQTEQAGYKIGKYEAEISSLKNEKTALTILCLFLIAVALSLYFNPKMFNKTSSIGGA